jgi:hypothetical protein
LSLSDRVNFASTGMEYLFAAVILYFVLQAASNIVLMIRGGRDGPGIRQNGQAAEPPSHDWRGPSPREQTGTRRSHPTFWNDVEEATWTEASE